MIAIINYLEKELGGCKVKLFLGRIRSSMKCYFIKIGLICFLAITVLFLNGENVKGEESGKEAGEDSSIEVILSDTELPVIISSQDGSVYLIRDGEALYVNESLNYVVGEVETPEGVIDSIDTYVRIGKDGVNDSSERMSVENGSITIGDIEGQEEYYLRFYKVIRTVTTESSIDSDDANNIDSNNNDSNTQDNENVNDEDERNEDERNEIIEKHDYIYASKVIHVVYDISPPVLDEISNVEWGKWVNYDRTAKFNVSDNASGISRVIVSSGDEIIYENHDVNIQNEAENDNGTLCFEIHLNQESFDANGIRIEVSAWDNAGNSVKKEYVYFLDKTAPIVSYTGISDRMISNKELSMQLLATDTIINTVKMDYSIVVTLRELSENYKNETVLPANGEIKYTENISKDGDYLVTAKAYDEAGNYSNIVSISFRIDSIRPDIQMMGVENNSHSRISLNPKIIIKDDFGKDAKAIINVTRKWPKGEEKIINDEFIVGSYEYEKSLSFNEDGDYYIMVNVTDAAGNNSSKEIKTRIDKTSPFVTVFGMNSGGIVSKRPVISATVSETFYDGTNVNTLLYRKSKSGIYEKITDNSISMADENLSFNIDVDLEGEYLLNIIATDETGNFEEKKLEFIYDCTAPFIGWINSISKKYFKSFSLPKDMTSNISDMTMANYKAYINTYELSEGQVITKNGKYILKIVAVDSAGNVNEETAEFIVDNKEPRIVVKGLTNKDSIKKGKDVTLSLYDKDDYFEFVKVDGVEKKLSKEGAECIFSLMSEGEHNIEVRATDFAGNITEKTFVVSCSSFSGLGTREDTLNVTNKTENGTDRIIGENNVIANESVKVTQKNSAKFFYIFGALFLGLSGAGYAIFRRFGRIDTTK